MPSLVYYSYCRKDFFEGGGGKNSLMNSGIN